MRALKKGDKVYVAGHRGMVGSSIVRRLEQEGAYEVVTRSRQELDLENQAEVQQFLETEKPDVVVIAAAKVGGIHANNSYPADFIARNLIIEHNLIWGSHLADVGHVQFLGSSCIYPRITPQPIPEEALLTGVPEPTNAPYAIAKIAGLYLCDSIRRQFGRNYYTVMPPNLYGPYDNFDLQTSHVLPAMIRKFHEAKPDRSVTLWGSGTPRREFLYVDDIADACHFLMLNGGVEGHINVGTGSSVSIKELGETVQRIVGHQGQIEWDRSKPDGFPEKTMDVSKLFALGWRPTIGIEEGIGKAYEWFLNNVQTREEMKV